MSFYDKYPDDEGIKKAIEAERKVWHPPLKDDDDEILGEDILWIYDSNYRKYFID
jgi:hypothetical protein